MWSVSDISWAFGCLVTLCTLSLWSWGAPSAGCNAGWRFSTTGTSSTVASRFSMPQYVVRLALLDKWNLASRLMASRFSTSESNRVGTWPEKRRPFVVMETTFSGQDVIADRLCHGGPISIARTRLGAELTWTSSGELWQLWKQVLVRLALLDKWYLVSRLMASWFSTPESKSLRAGASRQLAPVALWRPSFQRCSRSWDLARERPVLRCHGDNRQWTGYCCCATASCWTLSGELCQLRKQFLRNDFSYTLERGYGGAWCVLCKVRRTRRLQRLPALNAHCATSITIKEPTSWTAARHKKKCVCIKNVALMKLPLSVSNKKIVFTGASQISAG
ncbi:hypothetical protein V5799_020046 [Amblyomma americanum]|uniref:Secreted protein n=1 Tax=Amblyomma americanum TaxID=6943 RepID=A0AAQ4EVX1_AMBAM